MNTRKRNRLKDYDYSRDGYYFVTICTKNNKHYFVIQQYKAAVSKEIHHLFPDFAWQKSFFDHIIRDKETLYRIRKYIRHNVLKWDFDRGNVNHIKTERKQIFWTHFLRAQA